MSTDPLNEPEREVLVDKSGQFHLIHLLRAMTLVAILAAMIAPALRAMNSEHASAALIVVGIHLAFAAAAYFYCSYRRRKVLQGSGIRLGQSFSGSPTRQKRIDMFFMTAILFACVFVLLASLRVTRENIQYFPWRLNFNGFIYTSVFVYYLLHISWKRHFGAVEFFEHGVAVSPMKFTPWEFVDVQPHGDRANEIQLIVTRTTSKSHVVTVPTLVSPELCSYLLTHHSRPDFVPPLKKRTIFD